VNQFLGWLLSQFEAWNGNLLLLPNWHESQNKLLLETSLAIGKWYFFGTWDTVTWEVWPSLKCHMEGVVLIPMPAVKLHLLLAREALRNRKGYWCGRFEYKNINNKITTRNSTNPCRIRLYWQCRTSRTARCCY